MSTRSSNNSKAPQAPSSVGVGLLLRGIRRYTLLSFICFVLAGGAAAAVWFFLPLPKMTAYAVIQIKSTPDYIMKQEVSQNEFAMFKQSQAAIIKLPQFLSAAISKPELSKLSILHKDGIDPLVWLENELKVDFKLGSELMRVYLEGDNGSEMKAVVEAITDRYEQEVANRDKSQRSRRVEKLKNLLNTLDGELTAERKVIGDIAEDVGSGDLKNWAEKERNFQRIQGNIEEKLIQLDSLLVESQSQEKIQNERVNNIAKIPVPPETVNALLNADLQYQGLIQKKGAAQTRLDEFKKGLAPGVVHPGVAAREQDLANAQQEADRYVEKIRPALLEQAKDNMLQSEKVALEKLKRKVAEQFDFRKTYESRLQQLEDKTKKFNTNHYKLENLKGHLANRQQSAERYYQAIEALQVELDAPSRVTRIQDPVVISGIEGNRRFKYTLIAGLAFLVAGLGLVGGLEYRSRRVGSTDEVALGLGLRVIGTLPAMPKRALSRSAKPVNGPTPGWQIQLTESADNMRTMLLHDLEATGQLRTIMVTSALSGEGKTSLSGHLAVSLARAGFKTLLVDADMRRPSLNRVLGIPLGVGLSELLLGKATLSEVVLETPAPGLFVIPAGRWSSNLPRVLAGNAWRDLKPLLEAEFDYIVIDTSPLLPVADALMMARHVDGVVLSLLHDVSRPGAVTEAKQRLERIGVNVLGVVINGVTGGAYGHAYTHYYTPSEATTV